MTESTRSCRTDLPPGTPVLGRCVVERMLRRGPLVTVYAVRPRTGGEAHILRVVHPDLVHWSERATELFAREIERVKALKHPSIPRVLAYDSGPDGSRLLTSRTGAKSLRELMARGEGPTPGELAGVIASIAGALDSLHHIAGAPVMHRSVYPENVVVGAGHCWIEESGLVHALVHSELVSDRPSHFCPLGYQVPDVFHHATDPRVDVFGLALVAFETLTGAPAFESLGPSALSALIQVGHLPRVTEFCPELPSSVDTVFERAWALSAANAYSSPVAFASDLSALIESLGVNSNRVLVPSGLVPSSAPPVRTTISVSPMVLGPSGPAERGVRHTLRVGSSAPAEVPTSMSIPKAPRLPFENLQPGSPAPESAPRSAPDSAPLAPRPPTDPPPTFGSQRGGPPPLPPQLPPLLSPLPSPLPQSEPRAAPAAGMNVVEPALRSPLSLPPSTAHRVSPLSPWRPADAVIIGASRALAMSTIIAAVIATIGMVQLSRVNSARSSEPVVLSIHPIHPAPHVPLLTPPVGPSFPVREPSVDASVGSAPDVPALPLPTIVPRALPAEGGPSAAVRRDISERLRPRVSDCVEGLDPQRFSVRVRYYGSTGEATSVHLRGIFADAPIRPCIEEAVRSVRAPPSDSSVWEHTYTFSVPAPR